MLPVYLIHWNAADRCASALSCLLKSAGATPVAVTVIDNGGTDGVALADRVPAGVRVITAGRNVGFTGGANLALADWRARFPESEFCLLGAHDLHVSGECIERLLVAARQNPDFGLLGPALRGPKGYGIGVWNGHGAGLRPVQYNSGLVEGDWISGACMLVRREAVRVVGGFDERLHSYCEDIDLGLRMKAAGWKVGVVTDADAWELGSVSQSADSWIEANTLIVAAKHGGVGGMVRSALVLSQWTARSLIGGAALWRPVARRRESRRFLGRHLSAIGLLMRRWRILVEVVCSERPARAAEQVCPR